MKQYRIVLVDHDCSSRRNAKSILLKSGYQVIGEVSDVLQAERMIRESKPELAVIDVFLPGKGGFCLAQTLHDERLSAILFTSTTFEPELLDKSSAVGAAGFLVKPIEEVSLISAVELAIARFQEVLQLEITISELKEKLETRKLIERAKGILMETLGLSEDEAYKRIQKQSMNKRISMGAMAEAIIISHDL